MWKCVDSCLCASGHHEYLVSCTTQVRWVERRWGLTRYGRGYINSFGLFQTYYASTLDLPPSTISWIGSV